MNYAERIFNLTMQAEDTADLCNEALNNMHDPFSLLTDGYMRAVIFQLERHKTPDIEPEIDLIINSIRCASIIVNNVLLKNFSIERPDVIVMATTRTSFYGNKNGKDWFSYIIADICSAAGCEIRQNELVLYRPINPLTFNKIKKSPQIMILKRDSPWDIINDFVIQCEKDCNVAVINLNDYEDIPLPKDISDRINYFDYNKNDGLMNLFEWLLIIVWGKSTHYKTIIKNIVKYKREARNMILVEVQKKLEEKNVKIEGENKINEAHRISKEKAIEKRQLKTAIVRNKAGELLYLHPKATAFKVLYSIADGKILNSNQYTSRAGVYPKYLEFLRFIENNGNIADVTLPDGRKFRIKYTPGKRGGYPTSTVQKIE